MAAAPHSVCGLRYGIKNPCQGFHKLSAGERKVRAPQDRVLGNAQSR